MVEMKQEVRNISGGKFVVTWIRTPHMPWMLATMEPIL